MELSKQDRAALERLEEDLWREETRFDLKRMNEILGVQALFLRGTKHHEHKMNTS